MDESPSLSDTAILTPRVIEVCGLGKRFGSRWLFRGISFTLDKGDRLVVLGSNGSGKSTMLRIIAGLETSTEGQVKGEPKLSLAALDQALYPSLTCREHLLLASDLRGCEARDQELLEKISLAEAADKPASQLSTGMRTRLKMALAIQNDPEVLLLDEPGAGLDEDGRALVALIADEQSSRGALIFATNDPFERRLANLELSIS